MMIFCYVIFAVLYYIFLFRLFYRKNIYIFISLLFFFGTQKHPGYYFYFPH